MVVPELDIYTFSINVSRVGCSQDEWKKIDTRRRKEVEGREEETEERR